MNISSPIPWVGGKRAILKTILECYPKTTDRYIEVFGGGGSVLFGKQPETFEVYNDFDCDLVNFFRCMKYRPMALLQELKQLPLHSRADFNLLEAILKGENYYKRYLDNELEIANVNFEGDELNRIQELLVGRAQDFDVIRAAAFYKQCHYSYAGSRTSVDCHPMKITRTLPSILLAHRRLENVFIENKDFEALISQYDRPTSFFYCDPPYYKTEKYYNAEFNKEDHMRLYETLSKIKGLFLLSYNDCEFIQTLYKDFCIIEVSRLNSIAQQFEAGSQYKEVLITNYDLEACRKEKVLQLSLLDLI